MSDRDVLTDEMWARLEPLLPAADRRPGRPWNNHRVMLEAMIWRFRTGSPWRDMPERFPPWQSVWGRFDRWSHDGTFEQILLALQGQAQAAGEVDWTASVDSTVARAHQHAAGARRVPEPGPDDPPRGLKGGPVELQEFLARAG